MEKLKTVYIISDGTGETASVMLKATLIQFENHDINIIKCKNTRKQLQIDRILEQALIDRSMIVHTIINPKLRTYLTKKTKDLNLLSVDLIGDLMVNFADYLGNQNLKPKSGLLRDIDKDYFKRIEAIEFTVKYDDGKSLSDLDEADLILVGISRTSKTPLSILLSHKGIKVANIPLVLDVPPPEELFKVDQKKIVALTIDVDNLRKIRRKRLEKFQQDPSGVYADLEHINRESEYAKKIFKQNKRWPVFDVTDRALEETAAEIIKTVSGRLKWKTSKYLLF